MKTDQSPKKIRFHPRSSVFLFFITAVVLIYGVIYPNLAVVANSFPLANYRELLSQPIVIEAIGAFYYTGVSDHGVVTGHISPAQMRARISGECSPIPPVNMTASAPPIAARKAPIYFRAR